MASYLDTDMHSDGRRELYCFVGWASHARERPGDGPDLLELEGNFRRWASVEYERYVGADWDRPARALKETHRSPAGPPPWRVPGRTLPRASATLRETPGAWPSAERAALWDIARASLEDYVVAVGWQRLRDADGRVTHAAAEDVPERQARVPRSRHSLPEDDRRYRVDGRSPSVAPAGYDGRFDWSRDRDRERLRWQRDGERSRFRDRPANELVRALKWAGEKAVKVVRDCRLLEERSHEYDEPVRQRHERDGPVVAGEQAPVSRGSRQPRPTRQPFAADDARSGSLPSLRPASGSPDDEAARAARVDEEWDLKGTRSASGGLPREDEGMGEQGTPEEPVGR